MNAKYAWFYGLGGISMGWLLGSYHAVLVTAQPFASCVFDLLCR